jgi:hypothetical protein
MNKFQKLAQLNRDIELLENAGKIKAAEVLHQKFIKEAQYAMPMAYNPFMINPMMYSMMARPVVNPGVTTAPMPVAQPRTTQVQTTGQTPGATVPPPGSVKPPTPPTNQTAPGGTPVSYSETPSKPVDMGIPSPPRPSATYDNYYKDPRTGKIIFVDPGTGEDLPGQGGGYNVTPPGNYGDGKGGIVTVPPPGTITPPGNNSKDPMDDPRVKEFMKKFMGNDFLSGKQKEQMLDQFLRSIGLK